MSEILTRSTHKITFIFKFAFEGNMSGDKIKNIKNMENDPTAVEELFYKLKDYGETTVDLFKLKAINKVSGFTSTLIVSIILIVLLFLVLICISAGFALLIGIWLGNALLGVFYHGTSVYYHRTCFICRPKEDFKRANK